LEGLFLATAEALIDVKGANLTPRLGNEHITFNMSNAIGLPLLSEHLETMNKISHCVRDMYVPDPIQFHITDKVAKQQNESEHCHYDVYQVVDGEARELGDKEKDKMDRDTLKPLPAHLKYVFLGKGKPFLVIISNKLCEYQEDELTLLKRYRVVIGYSILDMKGISSTVCTHRIYLNEGCVPTREHQTRLNSHLQEVVKKEILRLLAADIIYSI
jgi:hypothetical protein